MALLLFSTSGCVVASSPNAGNSPGQAKFKHDRAVHYDLTEPRSAQDLGVPFGDTSAIFSRGSGDPVWDVQFMLPEGKAFHTSAFGVAAAVAGPAGLLDNEVVVNASVDSLDQMKDSLKEAIQVLGIPASEVALWEKGLGEDPLTTGHAEANFIFHGKPMGYLATDVEVRIEKGEPGAAINYTFYWDPKTIPSPMPSPAAAAPSKK